MRTDELDFELPEDRIATQAAEPRDAARLMVVHRDSGRVEHRQVRDLPDLGVLRAGDLMLVNHTRVLPASFQATRLATGGKVNGLFLETVTETISGATSGGGWRVMLEARGSLREGESLAFGDGTRFVLTANEGAGVWRIVVPAESGPPEQLLPSGGGVTPLPPYIRKARKHRGEPPVTPEDAVRYNTIYARRDKAASVAAPTAGLHFTPELLDRLASQGVQMAELSLNVGAGTFAPVRTDTLEEHAMHREHVHVPQSTLRRIADTRKAGGRLFVVGTTTVRALESMPDDAVAAPPAEGFVTDTQLFIYPGASPGGYAFRFTDMLMTNFHLPRSTLLAMIASLPEMSVERVKQLYREAIAEGYRFYSYGDAMLLA